MAAALVVSREGLVVGNKIWTGTTMDLDDDAIEEGCSSASKGNKNEDDQSKLDDDSSAVEDEANSNAGWANAMAKILNKKTPDSRPSILIKNKQREKEKELEKQERLKKKKQLDEKWEWEMMNRVKPDIARDREKERNLQKVATRGVVQLFNAVRKHQKNVEEKIKEAGGSERKRAKLISAVSKRDFISVLRGKAGTLSEHDTKEKNAEDLMGNAESKDKPGWSILRDDFMMGASMKDWDKESDDGTQNADGEHKAETDDSGSDSDR
ncbi:RRP15-like protein isoform X2 [Protopterus annectens]|uniref:RRP15-like protein isoform X2 n=1 Tax=Protopterus annectens TaxID=7888 RepID=UPI001CFAA77A|nr:RRP15-like protein isoform X2 [Protopterus annectens]